MSRAVFIPAGVSHRGVWWFDFATAEIVRTADGQRWRVEDVTPLNVEGAVDVEAVDRWVASQAGPA